MRIKSASRIILMSGMGLLLSSVLALTTAQAQSHYKTNERNVQYPTIGREVRELPQGSRSVQVNKKSYRYRDGSFYQKARSGAYVVVRAPVGAHVSTLPTKHVRFSIGARKYFFANLTYYLWSGERAEYIVVDKPAGAEAAMASSTVEPIREVVSSEKYVYPNDAQSDEQRSQDRYECYRWAVSETGFDPANGVQESGNASGYERANSACLEGRGYTVR